MGGDVQPAAAEIKAEGSHEAHADFALGCERERAFGGHRRWLVGLALDHGLDEIRQKAGEAGEHPLHRFGINAR
jgi:hypothetical protein